MPTTDKLRDRLPEYEAFGIQDIDVLKRNIDRLYPSINTLLYYINELSYIPDMASQIAEVRNALIQNVEQLEEIQKQVFTGEKTVHDILPVVSLVEQNLLRIPQISTTNTEQRAMSAQRRINEDLNRLQQPSFPFSPVIKGKKLVYAAQDQWNMPANQAAYTFYLNPTENTLSRTGVHHGLLNAIDNKLKNMNTSNTPSDDSVNTVVASTASNVGSVITFENHRRTA